MMDEAIDRKDCMGCKMCGDICPKGAITFETDVEGFWYPTVSESKCIKCGLCIRKCPVLNETTNPRARQPEVYAAWALDNEIRLKSTSGGVYYPFARMMLAEGGYIAGCAYADDYKSARQIAGNSQADLDKIFRSKYFQSDTGGIYRGIKDLLGDGQKVLWCGAPCQTAALLEYCGSDNADLITVDFICRGANSPKAHAANIRELEKRYGSSIEFFQFKNKAEGWTALGVLAVFKNGKKDFTRGACDNIYIQAYNNSSNNFTMRPSCANCRFKKIPRVADITIADFWGIGGMSAKDMHDGISLVMVNTDKGQKFYQDALPLLHSEKRDFGEAKQGNSNLYACAKYADTETRARYFKRIETEDFSRVTLEFLGRTGLKWQLKRRFDKPFRLLKRIAKKILGRCR
jgi:coenzyme F420-reducing hydrogenase beta subunit